MIIQLLGSESLAVSLICDQEGTIAVNIITATCVF